MKNNTLESVSCSSSGAAGGRDADGSGDADVTAGSYDTPSAAQHCTTSAAPPEAVPPIGRERRQVEIVVAPPPSPLPQAPRSVPNSDQTSDTAQGPVFA